MDILIHSLPGKFAYNQYGSSAALFCWYLLCELSHCHGCQLQVIKDSGNVCTSKLAGVILIGYLADKANNKLVAIVFKTLQWVNSCTD